MSMISQIAARQEEAVGAQGAEHQAPARGGRRQRGEKVFIAILAAMFLFYAAVSCHWRVAHDLPVMLYFGFLIDQHHCVPYRDIVDMNPPASHFVHAALYRLLGTWDLGYRLLDLGLLACLMTMIVLLMRRWGQRVAWCGALVFGLAYLNLGPDCSLEREYLCLAPLLAGLLAAVRMQRWPLALSGLIVGLLTGAAVSIKPHLGLALPVLCAGLVLSRMPVRDALIERRGTVIAAMAAAGAGVVVVPLLSLAWVAHLGGWEAFVEIAQNYWPLYTQLDGEAHTRAGAGARVFDAVRTFTRFPGVGLGLMVVGAYLGGGAMRRSQSWREPRAIEMLIIYGLGLVFLGYAWIGGKFWAYHYLPAIAVGSMLAGFAVRLLEPGVRMGNAGLKLLMLLILAEPLLHLPDYTMDFVLRTPVSVKHGDVDKIAGFLKENLKPGETVQPLDVTGGALHAMLLAGAKIATPYVYDFYFYHDPEKPYVAAMRRNFIREMEQKRPRFIIDFEDEWRVSGAGAAQDFPELDALMARDYREVVEERRYRILERKRLVSGGAIL